FQSLSGNGIPHAHRGTLRSGLLHWRGLDLPVDGNHRISGKFPSEMDHLAAEARLWGVEDGYFDVFGQWHAAGAETQRRLVAALRDGFERPPDVAPVAEPVLAFQGDGRRHWLLAVQLYALRSRRNWGHGDFTDLARLIELTAKCGAAGIGLN